MSATEIAPRRSGQVIDDLDERVSALGPELGTYGPESVAEAVRVYLSGKSVYQAARETRVREQRLRHIINLLGLKRSETEVMALRRDAGRAGAALQLERQREAAAIRRALTEKAP